MAKVSVKVSPKSSDPTKPVTDIVQKDLYSSGKGPIENNLDIRDRIFELIGKGNALSPDDKGAILANLTQTLGAEKAQKLMTQAYLFNTHPDFQKMPIENRIQQFYTIGSNDPDVKDIMDRTRNLGYGLGHGFRTSFSNIAKQLSGQIPITTVTDSNPEIKKKVMVKVSR